MAERKQEIAYRPGDLLLGKYRVERNIGEGGFGVVLAARHEALEERVAIKVLLPEAAAHAGAAERFLRRAKRRCASRVSTSPR
jgi:eukaryotic-like serine/threonine-protein kinase